MTGSKKIITDLIKDSAKKITLTDLVKIVALKEDLSPSKVKKLIRSLVEEGVIEYVNELGHTFPVISFNLSVRLSNSIVVHPPDVNPKKENESDLHIKIEKSTSFGRGDHPTTRLSLKAMEEGFSRGLIKKGRALDIGCGTGILGIAAVLMGMEKAVGVDIDPVALFDCKKNISLNRLEDRVEVLSKWPGNKGYSLLLANLRPPTLVEYKKSFKDYLKDDATLVFSGFKPHEKSWILTELSKDFLLIDSWDQNDWSSALMVCKGNKNLNL